MAEAETKERKPKKDRDKAKAPRQQANPIVRYFRETRGELRKVTWPTREETYRLTLIVLGVSIVTALFLGVFLDSIFSNAVRIFTEWTIGII